MRSIPVDPNILFMLISTQPALKDGQARVGDDGQPLAQVTVCTFPAPRERVELLEVRVPAARVPSGLMASSSVRFQQLMARPWQMEGRSGVAFSAAAVVPDPAPAPAKPAPGAVREQHDV
jgi:hypothetical protein